MSDSPSNDDSKPKTDLFEVLVVSLLGLAAIGAALAGYQEGLWGGKSVEAYGESNTMSTSAATTYNDELTNYMSDGQIDVEAKKAIWVGLDSEDEVEKARSFEMASYLYIYRSSEMAYHNLGLPEEARKRAETSEETVVLTEAQLEAALETDLDDAYEDEVFSGSAAEFEEAEAKFEEGRIANANGDEFSLAGVIFTIALFFAGLALVFKTKVRWGFFGVGLVIFVGSCLYLATLTWTK